MLHKTLSLLALLFLLASCSEKKAQSATETSKKEPKDRSNNICSAHDCELKHVSGYGPAYMLPNNPYHDYWLSKRGDCPHVLRAFSVTTTEAEYQKFKPSDRAFFKKSSATFCEECNKEFEAGWEKFKVLSDEEKEAYLKEHPSDIGLTLEYETPDGTKIIDMGPESIDLDAEEFIDFTPKLPQPVAPKSQP